MADERPIKMHVDEEMRSHIEFMARRHLVDLNHVIGEIKKYRRQGRITELQERVQLDANDREIALTQRCLREALEAGT